MISQQQQQSRLSCSTVVILVLAVSSFFFTIAPVDGRALRDGLLDPDKQPKFVELVPEALSDGFTMTLYDKKTEPFRFLLFLGNMFRRLFRIGAFADTRDGPTNGDVVQMGIYEIVQQTGVIDETTGAKLNTPCWGYGTSKQTASWPGPTFEVLSGTPVTIRWNNMLTGVTEYPFTSLNGSKSVLDVSVHWAYSIKEYKSYSFESNGIPIVTHLHGIAAEQFVDGFPEHFYTPDFAITGPDFGTKDFTYPNTQKAGNLWYHDHTLGITRLNVYAGLAGFYFIRDEIDTGSQFNTISVPYGEFEKAYAIQDRMFKSNGELFFPAYVGEPFFDSWFPDITKLDKNKPEALTEYFGDFMLVNGKIWPKQNVRATTYRMHLLNGCDTRYLNVQFWAVPLGATSTAGGAPVPFTVIGSDQGLFPTPVNNLFAAIIPSGSRIDVVVDFSSFRGQRIIMGNKAGDTTWRDKGGKDGSSNTIVWLFDHTNKIMAFDVDTRFVSDTPIKPNFAFEKVTYPEVNKIRRVAIFEARDNFGRLQPLQGGELRPNILESFTWDDPISELIPLGSVEEWDIINFSTVAHPMHLHYVHFEVISRHKIKFDTQAINRICGTRGAQDGMCLKPKQTTQHDGEKGAGFEAYVPTNYEAAFGDAVEVGSDYVGEKTQYKDVVSALPAQITRIRALFDKKGRFVWHCHFVSHEDHEMMRMFQVV